jgi:hypothetical protein
MKTFESFLRLISNYWWRFGKYLEAYYVCEEVEESFSSNELMKVPSKPIQIIFTCPVCGVSQNENFLAGREPKICRVICLGCNRTNDYLYRGYNIYDIIATYKPIKIEAKWHREMDKISTCDNHHLEREV